MKIKEIISKFSDIQIIEEKTNLIIASVSRDNFSKTAISLAKDFCLPLSLLFASDNRVKNKTFSVTVVFSNDIFHERLVLNTDLPENDASYESITASVMAAHWYERYMHDMFGVVPIGHPDLRRLVHHENIPENEHPLRKDFSWDKKLDHANIPYPMHHVEGDGIFEIPVGPIHAGIIEPGHFRFNVAGERIITLEGKLFFTHKGVEKLLEGKTVFEALPFIERLSGDMSASNALAFVQAVESVSEIKISKKAMIIRSLLSELERITMHIHDLGNIGGMGTGYSFVAANCFRIKEKMMRLSDRLVSNRFWRGVIIPGGVSISFNASQIEDLLNTVKQACAETNKIVNQALSSEGFMDRLQTTGILPFEAAVAFGALGLPARASKIDRDVRRDYPYAIYNEIVMPTRLAESGDVYARYILRLQELNDSLEFIEKICKDIPDGDLVKVLPENINGFGLGAVESWRGEILCAIKLKDGRIDRCFPRDPSFCNWALFGIIGPGNIVPDFPICNKSLNLSYSGTDM